MEKFAIGFVMGSVIGALLVANNQKMRALVKKAQDEAQEKIDAFMEEKIQTMEKCTQKASVQAEETVNAAVEQGKLKKRK
ncbi:MAG: hypothetical protein E7355_05545 [Clostridiales bacterium]|nr:hypothetical protein [Clostridiales bacterium]